MTRPDTNMLIARIYQYYPRGIDPEDPRHRRSPESKRLWSVFDACAASMGESRPEVLAKLKPGPIDDEVKAVVDKLQAWPEFVGRLMREFPDCWLWNTTIMHDPGYSCRVSQPGFVPGNPQYDSVVCLLSALAPIYALYASHVDEVKKDGWIRYSQFPEAFQEREAKLATLIEETFQFSRVPEDALFLPIPDVVPRESNLLMGQAKLIDCLFTSQRF